MSDKDNPSNPHLHDVETVTEDRAEMARLLLESLVDNLPVYVHVDDQVFFSNFGTDADQVEGLESARYVALDPLDPPVGNIRIRKAETIRLQFFTKKHSMKAEVTLTRIDAKALRFSFPEKLFLYEQHRSSFRVEVPPRTDMAVKVIRASGISFLGIPLNMSVGGLRFKSAGRMPKMAENFRFNLILNWPSRGLSAETQAIMIEHSTFQGEDFFRCQFVFGSHKTAIAIGKIVTSLQRAHLLKRQELFGVSGEETGA